MDRGKSILEIDFLPGLYQPCLPSVSTPSGAPGPCLGVVYPLYFPCRRCSCLAPVSLLVPLTPSTLLLLRTEAVTRCNILGRQSRREIRFHLFHPRRKTQRMGVWGELPSPALSPRSTHRDGLQQTQLWLELLVGNICCPPALSLLGSACMERRELLGITPLMVPTCTPRHGGN